VLGAGHNGLVAAAYLARAGRSVAVLERLREPGGATVSPAAFAGIDARVSRYAYLVSLLPALIVEELGLPLRLARRRPSSYAPDPRAGARVGALVDAGDAPATEASLLRVAGAAAHGRWRALRELTGRLAESVYPTLTEPLLSRRGLKARVGDDATWEAVFERPLVELLAATPGDDLLGGMALTDALIGTFASASSTTLAQNRCFLLHTIGRGSGEWLVPVGGMGAVTMALAQAALAAGAELACGAEVLGLEPDEGHVTVSFARAGEERRLRAGNVLACVAPAELERLLGRPRHELAEGSQLKLNLLLSRLPRTLDPATPAPRAFAGTFHVNETMGQLQRAYEEAAAGSIPALPPCEAYCHSLTDPTILGPRLRAEGVHALGVFVLHMPARLFRDDPDGAREAALAATMRSLDSVLAEPLLDCVLADADGRPCLEVIAPPDLERELCMPGGNIFHRELAWPFAESEEEVGRWGVETDHPHILLCGAGALRGGGVSGIPGRNAAMALLTATPR
jgi:phytoene dehydrogenase-like protein